MFVSCNRFGIPIAGRLSSDVLAGTDYCHKIMFNFRPTSVDGVLTHTKKKGNFVDKTENQLGASS